MAAAADAGLDVAIEVLPEVDSTQARLLSLPPDSGKAMSVCVAHHQTHGRGRLDRSWESHPGDGLMVSVCFQPPSVASVPLLVGVAVARATARFLPGIALKWPNDLVMTSAEGLRKLGGMVAAVHSDNPAYVVVGIGINFGFSGERPTPQASSLADFLETVPTREEVLISILEELVVTTEMSDSQLLEEYRRWCHTFGTFVRVTPLVGEPFEGTVTDVDFSGISVTDGRGESRKFLSGDVEQLRNS